MPKIVMHKQIPLEYIVPAGEIHAFNFALKDGTNNALTLTANHTFTETALNDVAVGKHSVKVFKTSPTNNQNKVLAGDFSVWVSPGLTTEISKNTEILNAITAVLEGKATDDLQSYSLAGRSVTTMTVADLSRLQAKYTDLVNQDNANFADGATGTSQAGKRFKNINFKFGVNNNV